MNLSSLIQLVQNNNVILLSRLHREQTMPTDSFSLIEKKWPVNAAGREMERSGISSAADESL